MASQRSTSQHLLSRSPPPPSYVDAIKDLPPDYAPAALNNDIDTSPVFAHSCRKYATKDPLAPIGPSPIYPIDFSGAAGLRECKGGKKKKNNRAQASNNWPGSENEGEKKDEGGSGGAADGNGSGGGAAGGDGGAGGGDGGGGGGDDGDDWGNDWATSGSKSKKKKKKQEEEEEQKRKEEEEEEKAAPAAATTTNNPLSWADEVEEANGDDAWGTFETVGAKKKKKGKVRKMLHYLSVTYGLSDHVLGCCRRVVLGFPRYCAW